ncbi:hypothetical protein V8E54_007904 [Elaphomyces granulatus]
MVHRFPSNLSICAFIASHHSSLYVGSEVVKGLVVSSKVWPSFAVRARLALRVADIVILVYPPSNDLTQLEPRILPVEDIWVVFVKPKDSQGPRANAPETTRRGRFISNFEADRLDGIETPLPDSDENSETTDERGDENMDNELPKIEDGLNRLKPTNFRCELLDYDNVKNWKARMKQLLSLQQWTYYFRLHGCKPRARRG